LAALEAYDRKAGRHLYTVLRCRMDHPKLRSPDMAEQLAGQIGKPVTAVWVRKRLSQAREKFGELLLEDLAQSLDNPTAEQIAEELTELGLLDYCREALEKRRPGA
jgi:hypothetical protein